MLIAKGSKDMNRKSEREREIDDDNDEEGLTIECPRYSAALSEM